MRGLADGFRRPRCTYLATQSPQKRPQTTDPAFQQTEKEARERVQRLLNIKGTRSVDSFHRELGLLMWDKCGMARDKAGLEEAIARIPKLREEFWTNLKVLGAGENINQSLEKAGRVADFFEFGELMCRDALDRNESCGGHFRTEYQTPDGEALRDDENYAQSPREIRRRRQGPHTHQRAACHEQVKLATKLSWVDG
jgi:succinate dehydrogenase / fumarate reductase flavoprotein subunit